ncbi:MAG: hypothetical protein IJ565_06750 [Bacilli bacterium]|nr:hypothetical protein [Bacilli bacterium]
MNEKRLEYLEKKVKLIDIVSRIEEDISGSEAKEIIKVINTYNDALDLLDEYDHRTAVKPSGIKSNTRITYDNCMEIFLCLNFQVILIDLIMNFLCKR